MFALKKFLHGIAIGLTKTFSKLMPDRAPMTFIGAGSTAELCRAIAESGTRKVLVVTDAGLVGLGLVAKVTALLEAAGVECAVYDEVQPDPTFAQVEAGLVRLRAEGCEAVLAIGGGSPMDAAKVISAAATNDRPLARLEGLMKVRKAPMPLYALPTTAGTGSEVTLAAVVSDTDTHTKKFFVDPKLIPLMTALDPELMLGLPAPITAATGMDALTHAVESYIAKTSTDQTERYAVAAVRLIFENLPKVYADGSDVEARKAMALASYYAGFAFTRTSVGYVHAIAHHFGAFYGTPHGLPRGAGAGDRAGRRRRRSRRAGVHRRGTWVGGSRRHSVDPGRPAARGHRTHRDGSAGGGARQLSGAALHERAGMPGHARADAGRLRAHAYLSSKGRSDQGSATAIPACTTHARSS
jgi:alcohol dehydrogenase